MILYGVTPDYIYFTNSSTGQMFEYDKNRSIWRKQVISFRNGSISGYSWEDVSLSEASGIEKALNAKGFTF